MAIGRREFLQGVAAVAGGSLFARSEGAVAFSCVPSYLRGYESMYEESPRGAARAWFKDSRFGLFMHFGISSMLGKGEWVQYRQNIPLKEYEPLMDSFNPSEFDADFITDLALEAGMKYVNITARHHDSFCLFSSSVSHYSVANSPARRDLIAELAEQCEAKGLGLFLYYSYALDWWHPYFYPRSYYRIARPQYDPPEPRYLFRKDEDFAIYIDFVHAQLRELLTNYGPLAGIWFDPIMGYYARPWLFPVSETYSLVRSLQPQTLISFKQGANGDEDFAAPEHSVNSLVDRVRSGIGERQALVAEKAWASNRTKYNEICSTLQRGGWGYNANSAHIGGDDVYKQLVEAGEASCNLLMNTGPLPDGSIHPEDVRALRRAGRLLRNDGVV
ncbi:MAG: alpha-L-fucosidase [Armatimonadetes bacterium]|nr:alpha-L-fucosidase [Armatimonadota bacterium]